MHFYLCFTRCDLRVMNVMFFLFYVFCLYYLLIPFSYCLSFFFFFEVLAAFLLANAAWAEALVLGSHRIGFTDFALLEWDVHREDGMVPKLGRWHTQKLSKWLWHIVRLSACFSGTTARWIEKESWHCRQVPGLLQVGLLISFEHGGKRFGNEDTSTLGSRNNQRFVCDLFAIFFVQVWFTVFTLKCDTLREGIPTRREQGSNATKVATTFVKVLIGINTPSTIVHISRESGF